MLDSTKLLVNFTVCGFEEVSVSDFSTVISYHNHIGIEPDYTILFSEYKAYFSSNNLECDINTYELRDEPGTHLN